MSSEFGKILRVSVFGQSHGRAIGVNIDGLPAGEAVDLEELQRFLDRRRPGASPLSTARKEADRPVILSGLDENGITCGAPLCAMIENSDQHSKDYRELADKPRPGHADYTAFVKWGGHADMRGGGHFSGRLTAPLCIAGGIARQLLERRGVFVGAHLASVGTVEDTPFPLHPTAELLKSLREALPVLNERAGEAMQAEILAAKQALDSVGGVIECAAIGLPAGLGDPMFDGIENRLAAALFGIPAVKGVEFGLGFAAARVRGSENNDPFRMAEDGTVLPESNRAGGILGGITTGMPVVLRTAMKPTPSIGQDQRTVSLSRREDAELTVHGRHDPCIAHRAVPVVEAVTAAVLLDLLLEGNHGTF